MKGIRDLLRERRDADEFAGDDSLDAAVDSLLVNAAKEATPGRIGESRRSRAERRLNEDEREFERPADGKTKPMPELDGERMGKAIADLCEDPARLLDLRGLILRRAVNFLSERYDDATVEAVKTYLAKQRGVRQATSSGTPDDSDSRYPAPRAGFAGPAEGG